MEAGDGQDNSYRTLYEQEIIITHSYLVLTICWALSYIYYLILTTHVCYYFIEEDTIQKLRDLPGGGTGISTPAAWLREVRLLSILLNCLSVKMQALCIIN